MLTRKEADAMTRAMQTSLVQAIETDRGEWVAVDDATGTEYGHKWRDGEARVFVEPETEDGPELEFVFAVRVVLVAVVDQANP
jgi:hypothetical protein